MAWARPRESPYPPSPSRRTLHPVVTVRVAGCSVLGAALCRLGVEPLAPARDAAGGAASAAAAWCSPPSRRLPTHGYSSRSVAQFVSWILASSSRRSRARSSAWRPAATSTVASVRISARPYRCRRWPATSAPAESSSAQRERVAARERVGQGRPVGEPCGEVRVVDARHQPLELGRELVELGEQDGGILGRALAFWTSALAASRPRSCSIRVWIWLLSVSASPSFIGRTMLPGVPCATWRASLCFSSRQPSPARPPSRPPNRRFEPSRAPAPRPASRSPSTRSGVPS